MKMDLILEMKKYHEDKVVLDMDNILEAIKYCGNYEANLYINGECVFSPLAGDFEDDKRTLAPYGIKYVLEGNRWIAKPYDLLVIKKHESDDWDRKTYKGVRYCHNGYVEDRHGELYTEVDNVLHSTTSSGEPDMPIRPDVKILILDVNCE